MISPASASERVSLPKAIGWSVAFMLLGIATSAVLMSLWAQVAYGNVGRGLNALVEPGPAQTIVAGSSQLLGFAFATWVIGFRVLRLGRADLRWFRPKAGAPGLVTGASLWETRAIQAILWRARPIPSMLKGTSTSKCS